MQISSLARRVLSLVFSLSAASAALTRPRLERQLGATTSAFTLALRELGELGLLDVQRLRLTLPGLAVAAACGARRRERRSRAPSPAQTKTEQRSPIQLFSQREAPRAVA